MTHTLADTQVHRHMQTHRHRHAYTHARTHAHTHAHARACTHTYTRKEGHTETRDLLGEQTCTQRMRTHACIQALHTKMRADMCRHSIDTCVQTCV